MRDRLQLFAFLWLIAMWLVALRGRATDYITESAGVLTFPQDASGYRIPDFSYAGYQYSNGVLPVYGVDYGGEEGVNQVTVSLSSATTDTAATNNQTAIQNAINTVEAYTPNGSGFRGVVIIPAGTWYVKDSGDAMEIEASGVVIRGAGIDATIIQDKDNNTSPVFRFGSVPENDPTLMFTDGRTGAQWDITTATVDVGSMSFDVEAGHALQIGDEIVIEHPCTSAWVTAVEDGGVTADAPWAVDTVPLRYWRTVTDVSTNTITIDAPVMYSLVRATSQCFVYEYTGTYLTKVGIEEITVDADHNSISTVDIAPFDAILFGNVRDGWARNARARNFRASGFALGECRNLTITGCESVDPHSQIAVTRRYNFGLRGAQLILFADCFARRGRHNYIGNGHAMDSGNVYLRSEAEDAYAASEHGHQRWSHGSLWDNCIFRRVGSPESGSNFTNHVLWLGNHGDNSNAHGWASATAVAYKSTVEASLYAIVGKPPTGMSYEIECVGDWRSVHDTWGDDPGALDITTSGTLPTSLFEAQLAQRLIAPETPDWTADYETIDFGFRVTSTDTDIVVTLTNVSGGVLSGTVTEDSAHYSIQAGGTITDLADDATHQVTLRYSPTTAAQHAATLTVTSGDGHTIAVTGIAAALQGGLSFDADTGTLVAPMADGGTYVATDTASEGFAVYAVTIPGTASYKIATSVLAESAGANSFAVTFDAIPSSPGDTWDVVTLTSGFEARDITRRGAGAFDAPESDPALWVLSAGTHFLVVQGREVGAQLATIAISSYASEAGPSARAGKRIGGGRLVAP